MLSLVDYSVKGILEGFSDTDRRQMIDHGLSVWERKESSSLYFEMFLNSHILVQLVQVQVQVQLNATFRTYDPFV